MSGRRRRQGRRRWPKLSTVLLLGLVLFLSAVLSSCGDLPEFQDGDGTDSVPDDTTVVEPPDTVEPPATPPPGDTIRVDSTSIRPDSVAIYIDTTEVVPSDTEDPYWLERQDTLNPGNYVVVRDLMPWGEWTAPDTVPGRILPWAMVFWEGQQMVGCSGAMCPRYGFPAVSQDTVHWERQPIPEPPPEPTGLASLQLETLATDAEAITVQVSWDGGQGPFRLYGCCRTFTGSWPGSPYIAADTVDASPAQVRQPRLRDSAQVDVCVQDLGTDEELCATLDVPDLPAAPEPVVTTPPDAPLGLDVVRTSGGFLLRWTDVVGETAYIAQQRCVRDGLDTWCRVWQGPAGSTEAAIAEQHDGSALEPGASYGYRLRACNTYGCNATQFTAGAAA